MTNVWRVVVGTSDCHAIGAGGDHAADGGNPDGGTSAYCIVSVIVPSGAVPTTMNGTSNGSARSKLRPARSTMTRTIGSVFAGLPASASGCAPATAVGAHASTAVNRVLAAHLRSPLVA